MGFEVLRVWCVRVDGVPARWNRCSLGLGGEGRGSRVEG